MSGDITLGNFIFNQNLLIGSGGFGNVYMGRDKRTNKHVAIKMMSKHILERHSSKEKNLLEQADEEVRLMKALKNENSPYLLTYQAHFEDEHYIYVIMELCKDSSLQSEIDFRIKNNINFEENEIIKALYQI